MRFLKMYQRIPGEAREKTNQLFNSFLIWTNQVPVSFTVFFEKMPELRMFFTDTVLQMQVEVGFDVFQYYVKLGARR